MLAHITHRMQRAWYAATAPLARPHVRDALTDALHPEFGWYWQGQELRDALACERHHALMAAAAQAAQGGPLDAAAIEALARAQVRPA